MKKPLTTGPTSAPFTNAKQPQEAGPQALTAAALDLVGPIWSVAGRRGSGAPPMDGWRRSNRGYSGT